LCKDGKYIWGQGSVINLLNDPNVNAIVANYRDITGNKELEDEIIKLNKYLEVKIRIRTKELEKANNELKMFTYSVSHDLRTPLAAIDGFATFIDEFHKNDLNEEVKESIVHIKNSAKRMNSLINDLLNLSKVGKIELLKKENNIQSLIMKVIDDYKITNINAPLIIVNPINIKCKIDESLMQQVWMNLISNAVKYSAKKQEPKIEIGYDEFENEYEFYIKDNGVGFDMSKADKLFGVFQRMHNNTEFEGTGIGLALVKLIIEKHGGTIWANSVINEGTTFYFTLPKK
jgi:light-regulated signal transduction histidine kinase (bacteriophytochrome)